MEHQIRKRLLATLGLEWGNERLRVLGRIEYGARSTNECGEHVICHLYQLYLTGPITIRPNVLAVGAWGWWTTDAIRRRLGSHQWYFEPCFRAVWTTTIDPARITRLHTLTTSNALPERDHTIDAPIRYMGSLGGKMLRPRLVLAIQDLFGLSDTAVELISSTVQDLHCASLVADDIEDQSATRRGARAAHCIFGIPLCMNAYGLAMVRALSGLARDGPAGAVGVVADTLERLHCGQGAAIQWSDCEHVPTKTEYENMVRGKTSALLTMIPRMAALFSMVQEDATWVRWFEQLGVYFQIRDDLCNVCDPEYWAAKGFFEDLDEGKMSYLMILGLHSVYGPCLRRLLVRTNTYKPLYLKYKAYWMLYDSGALHQTREHLLGLHAELLSSGGGGLPEGLRVILDTLHVPAVPDTLPPIVAPCRSTVEWWYEITNGANPGIK